MLNWLKGSANCIIETSILNLIVSNVIFFTRSQLLNSVSKHRLRSFKLTKKIELYGFLKWKCCKNNETYSTLFQGLPSLVLSSTFNDIPTSITVCVWRENYSRCPLKPQPQAEGWRALITWGPAGEMAVTAVYWAAMSGLQQRSNPLITCNVRIPLQGIWFCFCLAKSN